jgi:NAD(P)-dependent dehydrogenase (short-subunit alcohol dehydrogenase family)
MRSVGPYWNDEHKICRVAAATADTNGKRTGFFSLTQRAIGQMLRQGSGHVVNISASVAQHLAGVLDQRSRHLSAWKRRRVGVELTPTHAAGYGRQFPTV